MIRNRIWYELGSSRFYLEYLALHIRKVENQNKLIDNITMLLSFGGIAGWYKYADYSVFWSSLLIIVNGARLMKSKFQVADSEISALKSSLEFYIDNVRELENVWYNLNEKKITEQQAIEKFEKCREGERLMMKINKHSVIM